MSERAVLSPITIKGMTLNNRVVMPPIGTNFANVDGSINQEHINYYEQRSKGGTGLIIVENVCIDFPMGTNGTTQLRMDNDQYMPGLYKLTETIHRHGAKCSVQINHAGASASPLRLGGVQQVSASNIPSKTGGAIPRPLTIPEIKDITKAYAEGALRAKRCGFDAVEIHAGHSYLLSQFLSPITNDRTDEYGGTPEKRCRFAKEVVEAVRKAVGPHFPIMLRLSADEFLEGGNTLEDTLQTLKFYTEEVDILDVSCALNDSLFYQIDSMDLEDGWRSYLSREVKRAYPDKVTICSGNIRSPQVANEIVESGDSDLVAMGRGLIAEPNWVQKVKDGNEALLRKCISCNIGCADHRIGKALPIRCTVNPDLFLEDAYKEDKVKNKIRLAVIGGGTAGMEAACTAAEIGCDVVLFERRDFLGGLSKDISRLPDKIRIEDFPIYMIERVKSLSNIDVRLNHEVRMSDFEKESFDMIVNATGSVPLLPPIKGLIENLASEDVPVHSIFDLIHRLDEFKETEGKEVVIIGGGAVGLDVAEYYAKRGAKKVSVVDMQDELGKDLDLITKVSMVKLINKHDIQEYTETKLLEVCKDHFLVERDKEVIKLNFDVGFICMGMKSFAPLMDELYDFGVRNDIPVVNIGDSKRARRIIDGVREGHDIQYALRELDQKHE